MAGGFMTGPPFFSVVTVTRNARTAAERTARSVLAQTFTDFEYLIKDGASTDQTGEALSALGPVRLVSQPDTGVYDAMNQALTHCRGRYVCFMNAGDAFANRICLSTVAEAIRCNGYPEFVYGDVVSLDGAGHSDDETSVATGRRLRYRGQLTRHYLYRRMICHQVWFVERSVFERVGGFDTQFRISAAYDFLLRMVLGERVRYARVPWVVAVYEGGGLSSVDGPEKRRERQLIMRRHFSLLERVVFGATWPLLRLAGTLLRVTVLRRMPPDVRARLLGF